MKLFYCILILILSASLTRAQHPVTYYIGAGKSIMNKGSMHFYLLHNELAIKINSYISTSVDLQLARSYSGVLDKAEYIQGNLNILYAPFKNEKNIYFQVGSGIFYNRTWNYFDPKVYPEYEKNVQIFRLSLFLEDEFKISNTIRLGLRIFTYPKLSTNETISGVLIKAGFRI
jgi:hypothetical protein